MAAQSEIRHRVFTAVSLAAVLFAVSCWGFVLVVVATGLAEDTLRLAKGIGIVTAVLALDGLASYWAFRRLRPVVPQAALRVGIAFAITAPLVFGLSNLVGELAGTYAEGIFGSRFAVAGAIASNLILMALVVPAAVSAWVSPHIRLASLGENNPQ